MTDVRVLCFSAAILLASARSESSSRLVVLIHQNIPSAYHYVTSVLSSRSLLPLVQFLQTPNPDRIAPAGGDPFRRSFCAAQCGDTRHPVGDRRPPDGLLIAERMRPRRSVDHQLERTGFEQIHR